LSCMKLSILTKFFVACPVPGKLQLTGSQQQVAQDTSKISEAFFDNMVSQRGKPVNFWGWPNLAIPFCLPRALGQL